MPQKTSADSDDPCAHHALACVHLFSRRFDDSLAEFELALRLNPNFSLAQGYYGLALSCCGRWKKATPRRAVPCARARSIRSQSFIAASPRLPSSSGATTKRRCVSHAKASGNARISSTPTACRRPPRRWRDSLAWLSDQMPIKRQADREHYLEGFRRAGLD
jgi:hypothetical protein